jgi:hypothetical protein
MAGTWEGNWASSSKPLHGRLSAAIERLPDSNYRASFLSENPLFGEEKSVCIFHVSSRAAAWEFQGRENLGLLKGGVYDYKGTVDGNDFFCTYDSTFDKGVFRMRRR